MTISKLAILGGEPEFTKNIPVGQLYFPTRKEYIQAMEGIFEREYYTNSGPILEELEKKLASYMQVKDAILVANNTLGLIMTAEALDLKGSVILPALTFIASALSLKRCSLKPKFCDISPNSIFPTEKELEEAFGSDVSGVLGVNLWGSCAPIEITEKWATNKGIQVYWDSAQAFGCEVNGKKVGGNGAAEIFSFHATKILSTAEGGCITTNDKELADSLRNIRSGYGVRKITQIKRTTNARVSEMQAAVGMIGLDRIEEHIGHNLKIYNAYKMLIRSIPGLELLQRTGVTKSNYQSVILIVNEEKFGLSRDLIVKALNAEGILARRYFLPSLHKLKQFSEGEEINLPNTEHFQSRNIVMPIGARTTPECIYRICNLLKKIKLHSSSIKNYG